MMEELKPCPFCGGEAEIFALEEPGNLGGTVAGCKTCMCSTRVHFSLGDSAEDQVTAAWNTRPADELTRLRAENEALREVLEGAGVSLRAVAGHSVQESMARDAREVSEKIKRVLFND